MEGSMHGTRYRAPAPARLNEGRGSMQVLYWAVRGETLKRAAPLSPEDQCLQSMPDASPTKWHLAHTTWFFEAMLLRPMLAGYTPYDPQYSYLFNSYYESLGARVARPQRGLMTRPALSQVLHYRESINAAVEDFIMTCDESVWHEVSKVVTLGLQHEQQHQELILTDILHLLSCHPFHPAYSENAPRVQPARLPLQWCAHPGGVVDIGHDFDIESDFAFDNEGP